MLHDPCWANSLLVTLEYVLINIVVQTILAVGIAVLMQRVAKSTLIRGTLLLPVPDRQRHRRAGLVLDARSEHRHRERQFLEMDRADRRNPGSADAHLVIPTIALVNVWRYMGYTALLIFAGLQTIPASVYEAASLDGAGRVQDLLQDHPAVAAPGAGAGADHHASPGRSRSSTPSR